MCRVDGVDRSEVYVESSHRARKEHRCEECRRTIMPSEVYRRVFAVTEGDASSMKVCGHCVVAMDWLVRNCGGYIYGEVREDIHEHAQEYQRLPLARIAVGMRRKWARFTGPGLLAVPPVPDSLI